jgi:lysophospholipase L1-like esterase
MLQILCYGDSLTAGYSDMGCNFTPYGKTMEQTLGADKVCVKAVGMSGWTTEQMVDCADDSDNTDACDMEGDGLKKLVETTSYDIVCLMCGTNDLGIGFSVEEIVTNFKKLLLICLSNPSTKVALLSVPPTGNEMSYESVRTRRAEVNSAIAQFHQQFVSRTMLIEVEPILSNPGPHPAVPTPQSALWDRDFLHFSPEGSATLGKLVASKLVQNGWVQ